MLLAGNNYDVPEAYTSCIKAATGGTNNITPDNYAAVLKCEEEFGKENVSLGQAHHRRTETWTWRLVQLCNSTPAVARTMLSFPHTTQIPALALVGHRSHTRC